MQRDSGRYGVPAVGDEVGEALHLLGGRVGGQHQVLHWSSQFITEVRLLCHDHFGLVLQGLLEREQPADELPDSEPGLERAEGGS